MSLGIFEQRTPTETTMHGKAIVFGKFSLSINDLYAALRLCFRSNCANFMLHSIFECRENGDIRRKLSVTALSWHIYTIFYRLSPCENRLVCSMLFFSPFFIYCSSPMLLVLFAWSNISLVTSIVLALHKCLNGGWMKFRRRLCLCRFYAEKKKLNGSTLKC